MLVTAQFHPTNEHMPHGLGTEIGERGVNLSGGQRQRVNLARCGYFARPILLLDDCLSAVDIETEKSLVEDLFLGLWKQKTRILVTHRLSVLPYADAVAFMENGEIVEMGRFDDLQKSSARMQAYIAAHERKRDARGGAE
jgi:ABC-type multidrug transport system fused ATPase/permease subunit